jgi:hypothetical protein
MASGNWCRSARTLLGVAATLALLAQFAPTSARASCSHYAVARHDPMAATARLALFDDTFDAQPTPAEPTRPAPCTGPACSGRTGFPQPATSPSQPVRLDQWVCIQDVLHLPRISTRSLPPASQRAAASGPVDRIDRPPRPTYSGTIAF